MRIMKVFLLFLAILIVVPFINSKVFASENPERQKVTTLPTNEVVDGDYLVAGERVEIYGTVNGDVYAIGGVVMVQGKVNGDVLVAGGVVIIGGEVTQNVRVVGGDVSITGKIGRNVTYASGSLDISESSRIDGSVVGGSGNVFVYGQIGGDFKNASGTLTLTNSIDGDVETSVNDLRLTSDASIDGNLVYWSEFDASIDQTATVSGTITKKIAVAPSTTREDLAMVNSINHGFRVYWFVSTLAFGLLFTYFFSKYISNVSKFIENKPWRSMGIGFIVIIVFPVIIFMVFLSVIGIPTATFLLFAYFMILYLAKFFSMVWVGSIILKRFDKPKTIMKAFLVGFIVYSLLKIIPVVGFFTSVGFMLAGLGALFLHAKESYLKK